MTSPSPGSRTASGSTVGGSLWTFRTAAFAVGIRRYLLGVRAFLRPAHGEPQARGRGTYRPERPRHTIVALPTASRPPAGGGAPPPPGRPPPPPAAPPPPAPRRAGPPGGAGAGHGTCSSFLAPD